MISISFRDFHGFHEDVMASCMKHIAKVKEITEAPTIMYYLILQNWDYLDVVLLEGDTAIEASVCHQYAD